MAIPDNHSLADGLFKSPKVIPSRYFYDDRGSALFTQIMELPEYYLTRCEIEIFEHQKAHIFAQAGFGKNHHFELVELGAGDGRKTRILLTYLLQNGFKFTYRPIDISAEAIASLSKNLSELDTLRIQPLVGDYHAQMDEIPTDKPKMVLFIGSNLGNMSDAYAHAFLSALSGAMRPGDYLLLGVDLKKDATVILPAYDDAQGVTRAFNLNLLRRMNETYAADFDLSAFDHVPEYDPSGQALSYLVSLKQQQVVLEKIDRVVHFEKGEKILTEISRKYDNAILTRIMEGTQFTLEKRYTDSKGYFANYLLARH